MFVEDYYANEFAIQFLYYVPVLLSLFWRSASASASAAALPAELCGEVGSCSAWHPRPSRHLLPRAFPFQRENGARNANGRRKKQASKEAKKGEQAKRKEGSKATVFLGDHLSFFSFLRPPSFRTYGIIGQWGSFVRLFFLFSRGRHIFSHPWREREEKRERNKSFSVRPILVLPTFFEAAIPQLMLAASRLPTPPLSTA